MLLNDTSIRRLCIAHEMIVPYVDYSSKDKLAQKGQKKLSYGLSSYGYDARLANAFEIFDNHSHPLGVIDSKKWDPLLVEKRVFKPNELAILPPHSFALAHTVEYFRIPRNILVICLGKSTYARCGLIINVTPLEPEWEGQVTLELSNTTPFPLRVYPDEGIAQFLFFEASGGCEMSYADKKGKYQAQVGIMPAQG